MGVTADAGVPPTEQQDVLSSLRRRESGYESKTGKAWTEKPASFKFDRGEGQSTGAEYDPTSRELHMRKDVHLKWFDSAKPMESRRRLD